MTFWLKLYLSASLAALIGFIAWQAFGAGLDVALILFGSVTVMGFGALFQVDRIINRNARRAREAWQKVHQAQLAALAQFTPAQIDERVQTRLVDATLFDCTLAEGTPVPEEQHLAPRLKALFQQHSRIECECGTEATVDHIMITWSPKYPAFLKIGLGDDADICVKSGEETIYLIPWGTEGELPALETYPSLPDWIVIMSGLR